MVPHWVNEICEKTTAKLVDLKRPYKFVVTCLMQQKVGPVSAHLASSCYFENATDGVVTVMYPGQSRQKEASSKTLGCLITTFATRF